MAEREIQEDLAALAWQLRVHAEMDRGFGLRSVPCPSPSPIPLIRNRPAPLSAPRAQASPTEAPRRELKLSSSTESAPRPVEKSPAQKKTEQERVSPRELRIPDDPRAIEPVPFDEATEALQARRERGAESLRNLYRELDGCTRCPLHQGRSQIVFGQGDSAAELVFVGEGPGEQEDRQGLAFCGPSGDLLTKMIQAMGLDREDVFIANVVKCRPPQNRKPFLDEMKTCLPYLERQLEIIRPRVIIALGKTAAEGLGLLRPEESLTRNRGFHHRYRGIRVMVTFHPAYLLRQVSMKRQAWQDLQQVLPYLKRRQDRA